MDLFDRLSGVDNGDGCGVLGGLGEEAGSDAGVKGFALEFHAIEGAIQACGSDVGGEIENDRQIGHQARHGYASHLPERGDVQAAGMALIDDVGQQIAVGDDSFSLGERGADDFLDQLGPGGHVEEHFAAAIDGEVVSIEEEATNSLSEGRTAGIAADDDVESPIAEPLDEEGPLGRFSAAINTIKGEEHGSHCRARGTTGEPPWT